MRARRCKDPRLDIRVLNQEINRDPLLLLKPGRYVRISTGGYWNDPVMAQFRDYGFSGVVPKPYGAEDLAQTLDELFGGHADLQIAPADVVAAA